MKTIALTLLAVVTFLSPVVLRAQELSAAPEGLLPNYQSDTGESFGTLVFDSTPRIHKYLGYVTMAGVLATGLTGWLSPGDLHGTIAGATTALAVTSTGLGIVSYVRNGYVPLPHVLLTTAGTIGFIADLTMSGHGSTHRNLGTASAAAFGLSLIWVIDL